MAFGHRILGYVAMSYEDLVAEYREVYWALQNLALPRLRQFTEFRDSATRREHRLYFSRLAEQERSICLLYTSPSPRDRQKSRMPSSA